MTAELLIDGKYRLLERLGSGNVGVVHAAEHLLTRRRVALKLLHPDRLGGGQAWVERFTRETRTAGSLQSPHVVSVLDAGTDAATQLPYLVMELLSGRDLGWWLDAAAPLPWPVAVEIATQVCRGLSAAHRAGVIHRDVKPTNIVLAEAPESDALVVKLVDFGIAKRPDEVDARGPQTALTSTGSLLGSPLYMAPEQAQGLKTVDGRADLWSLGVVLYQLLTGQTPHGLQTAGVGELIVAISTQSARPVQQLAPWVPAPVAAVLHRLLQIDPRRRFPSAEAVLAALEALTPARRPLDRGQLRRLTSDERRVRARRFVSPRRRAFAASLVALALALVGLGVWRARAVPVEDPVVLAPPAAPSPAPALEPPPVPVEPPLPEPEPVWVAVTPPSATVELDGRAVALEEGRVPLRGAPGSVHELRVKAGAAVRVVKVVLTERGPVPAEVTLPVSKPRPKAAPTLKPRTRFE